MTDTTWRKSSYSHQEGDCIEVDQHIERLRDSKNLSAALAIDLRTLLEHLQRA